VDWQTLCRFDGFQSTSVDFTSVARHLCTFKNKTDNAMRTALVGAQHAAPLPGHFATDRHAIPRVAADSVRRYRMPVPYSLRMDGGAALSDLILKVHNSPATDEKSTFEL
jgi:hypothetical protein